LIDSVVLEDFTQAIERLVAGLQKKNRLLNPYERRVVAFHETGYAPVRLALPGIVTVHKISIIPRGIGALGYTIQRPSEDRYLMTQAELLDKMAALLGGRAAEVIVFEELSTGAADSLAKVTNIARSMITRCGENEELRQVAYESDREGYLGQPLSHPFFDRSYSEQTAWQIDEAL